MATSRFKPWAAYEKGFKLAEQVFELSKHFPKEERYSLTDQVRRSSRSVCANLAEAFGRRNYPKHFVAKLADCVSENFETQVWLDFAWSFSYMDKETYEELVSSSEEVGRLLTYMTKAPERFTSK